MPFRIINDKSIKCRTILRMTTHLSDINDDYRSLRVAITGQNMTLGGH